LEVQGTGYTERFGTGVRAAHSFDIVAAFQPTYLCDFSQADGIIPSNAYDCLVLPNTLPHFRDLDRSLATAWRVLRLGGVMLASTAGLLPLTGDAPEYARFTPDGWRERFAALWPGVDVVIGGRGNCLASVAAQLGLACEELRPDELNVYDPRYPILTTIAARKL
jgi:hypothetical protein